MSAKITVTVSRTIQTAPYESSKVEVTETYSVPEDKVESERDNIFSGVTKAVNRYVKNEQRKYSKGEA